MAGWARAPLGLLVAAFLLALAPWPAQAGSADDPEITDPADDGTVAGVFPVGLVPTAFDQTDLRAGWVNETADDLLLSLQSEADSLEFSPLVFYEFSFSFSANGTTSEATASGAGSLTAGGVASEVAVEGNVITFTVPKSAVGAFLGDALGDLAAASSGTLVSDPLSSSLDEAAAPEGTVYVVSQGFARGGSASDVDGDGLPDAWETQHFAGIEPQNGTGDPDGDGLDNAAENAAGTDPNDMDTDGDVVDDGADPFPLDPTRPADADGDGLPDAWERENFDATDAQSGSGDPDSDGLDNAEEIALGTDPNKADTDGDGIEDGDDSDPLEPNASGGDEATREVRPELYGGAALFAAAATFLLIGLAKGT